ncbi:type II toxin-antitoxin system VapC family toxin [Microlunatus antarcticus]|uniref:Ribonuclease VapC n=1 Tax=Microlunatus antarcticus TaxID=53388 RepID=A0A7W5P884_9ACTN|nr:type II toxin-antitoxin system VapC family toxin [Microlunatus antarcticus]MBB3327666.1 putative nucleic acid-binding protein [Microlunatus antarcticus]
MIVVDASALVQALLQDASARAALRGDELHAPFLIDSEVLNALRGHFLGGRISDTEAALVIAQLGAMDLSRHSAVPLAERAWELRSNLTAYDASYVALAERLGGGLVTADARIARAPGLRCSVHVVS